MKYLSIYAPSIGDIIKLTDIKELIPNNDYGEVGIAVYPDSNIICSPVDGTVKEISDNNNTILIGTECGLDILVRFGLDSYRLKGKGIGTYVKVGEKVKDGDKLIFFDRKYVSKITTLTTLVIVTNPDIITNKEENVKSYYTGKGRLIMNIKIEEVTT